MSARRNNLLQAICLPGTPDGTRAAESSDSPSAEFENLLASEPRDIPQLVYHKRLRPKQSRPTDRLSLILGQTANVSCENCHGALLPSLSDLLEPGHAA
jgi:hypothetical protein